MSDSAAPWTAAHEASLSITNSQNLLKLMSIELVTPSNHLVLCCPDRKSTRLNSSHITSWQIKGEKMETPIDFIFLGSKITADGDCSHEIKHFILGRKDMTNLDNVLNNRDITLLIKVLIFEAGKD